MESHIWFPINIIIIFFFCITILPKSHSEQQPDGYWDCYHPFQCGNSGDLYYPFWSGTIRPSHCGGEGFELHCPEHQSESDFPSIWLGSQTFNITWIDPDSYLYHSTTMKLKMVRTNLAYDSCSSHLTNTSLMSSSNSTKIIVRYGSDVKNVTLLYHCPSEISVKEGLYNFTCQQPQYPSPSNNRDYFYLNDSSQLQDCKNRIQVPISGDNPLPGEGDIASLNEYLNQGFNVALQDSRCTNCSHSGGICGSNAAKPSQFICYCPHGDNDSYCGDRSHPSIMVGAAGALLMICATFCYFKIKFWKRSQVDQKIETFIKNHGPLALTRYEFSDIKRMTKSFKVKLGQGGYGCVYKGELLNGCQVAVKILTASKENGQDFINEVASISRTSHINVVTLLGFCLEGQRKALIYEYMPNGSLDKFIHKNHNNVGESAPSLTLEKFYQIAIGIARGLEYLHKGCNTRIVHFDIKPHNILLDEDFCPKISDFGLAKLCPRKESIISISDARGTIGYVAPEMWNRNFGGVSHKSDVYSYGMMLLDIVGERMNTNDEVSSKSEKYFPDWIYSKLEEGCSLGSNRMMTKEEDDIAKRMTVVGLWCIQTFAMHRPTISRVIEMLEGSLDSLEIPPKPVMSSPTRIEAESSTATTTITATY